MVGYDALITCFFSHILELQRNIIVQTNIHSILPLFLVSTICGWKYLTL